MYTRYYGLDERPFALVPDPRFLFLSRGHREALAHLLYGIEAGEGFIEIVGQVGTGKTTLCRTLLGRVGPELEIAYIFNPSPSEIELLSAICRELGLPAERRTRAELLDQLNRLLLRRSAEGRRVLLVIDEAQNLVPPVLEQVRLLSNLETEREKLLQIVLIGQPELEENLARADLRQLRQRITVRWGLGPFKRREVEQYVTHRLAVAGRTEPGPFTRGALRALYRYSRGVPRIINSLADRALLAGYSRGAAWIGARTIRRAARELPASEALRRRVARTLTPGAATALVVCGLVLGFFATVWWPETFTRAPADVAVGPGAPTVGRLSAASLLDAIVRAARSNDAGDEAGSLARHLRERSSHVTTAGALRALLVRWGSEASIPPQVDPNLLARTVRAASSLKVFVTRATLDQLEALNLPTLLEIEVAPGELRYAALLRLDAEGAELAVNDFRVRVPPATLDRMWTGRAFFLWSNFESLPALTPGMNGSAVRWLQARLTELGYLRRGDASGDFDGHTASAVRRFQSDHALDDTGEVGPETLIALYQELRYTAPRLVVERIL